MKIEYNLTDYGLPPDTKKFRWQGDILSYKTLQSILSLMTSKYVYQNTYKKQTIDIFGKEFQSIRSNYKPYLKFLIDSEIIYISSNHYLPGEYPRAYAFVDEFKRKVDILNIKPSNYFTKEKYNNVSIINKSVLEQLKKDYECIKVKEDFQLKKKNSKFRLSTKKVADFKNYILNITNLLLLDMNRGLYFENTNDRVYTNFVNLCSEAKEYISFGDDKLVEFDITSSFPLFFGLWLKDNEIRNDEFYQAILTGDFYTDLKLKLNIMKDKRILKNNLVPYDDYNRDETKEAFQRWLNGDNINKNGKLKINSKVKDDIVDMNYVFSTYYPDILDTFIQLKDGDRRTFYFILEKMEANFIFNNVIEKLYENIQGVKILTCHDAIYIEEKFQGPVGKIWRGELDKLYKKIGGGENE